MASSTYIEKEHHADGTTTFKWDECANGKHTGWDGDYTGRELHITDKISNLCFIDQTNNHIFFSGGVGRTIMDVVPYAVVYFAHDMMKELPNLVHISPGDFDKRKIRTIYFNLDKVQFFLRGTGLLPDGEEESAGAVAFKGTPIMLVLSGGECEYFEMVYTKYIKEQKAKKTD